MPNIFDIEKLNAVPGIYIIYNAKKRTAYIGQAKDMKERMKTHIKALYISKDDNASLQAEFDTGDNDYIYRSLEFLTGKPSEKNWTSGKVCISKGLVNHLELNMCTIFKT